MSTTIKVPDNIPVSWLDQLQQLNPDMLLLASEPTTDTETQYMSKYLTYSKLSDQVSEDLQIGKINSQIAELSSSSVQLTNYLDGTLSLDVSDPYIMSSMTYVVSSDNKHFGPLSCSGYRLSAGINTVFQNINKAGKELTTIIPQLAESTFTVTDPTENYISSITDKNGHITGFGYGKLSDVIEGKIGVGTKEAGTGYAISSITTEGGKVTEIGQININDLVGKKSTVWYKDYTSATEAKNEFEQVDFYVMKLKLSQLQALSSSGGIKQDCVYMTINDEET